MDPEIAARVIPVLAEGPLVRLAMLFGSAAAGHLRPDSDVDVAIVPDDPDLPLSAELDLQARLSAACGREVDLIRLDRAGTLVRWQVARHGRPLIQNQPFEAARFAASAAAEYLDFRPALARAAELFRVRLAGLGEATQRVSAKDLLLRQLSSLRDHGERIRRRRAGDIAAFKADVDRQDALGMSLLVAVKDALDIALHVAADEGWGVPGSYAEGFALLANHGVMDAQLAGGLARMAALRNRLAHGYASVDVERIWNEIPAGMAALDGFASAIAVWLDRPSR